ncbi:GNAT family protein [Peribacillus sp. FSL H8-0477]|uniref:GNAT family N-acetyltransferase n=1 Tax=Peribacillus sp. FSL H8-0477 TaxID=2921388 RepID=UPI0030FBA37F
MKVKDIYGELQTLSTDRLLLRKFAIGDAEDMFEYASEPDVSRFVPWESHNTIKDTYEFLNLIDKQYQEGKIAPWAIEFKQTKKVIGTIDFVAWFPINFRAELGFILSKDHWGDRIILAAAAKVKEFGFNKMKLNRIKAPCMVENSQSQRVLQKIGMKLEGVSREKYFIKGKFRDIAMYSILRNEYLEN